MSKTRHLMDDEGIHKLQELVDAAKICHMTTALDKRPIPSRPMSTAQVDAEGNIWFLSRRSSNKNAEIVISPEVQLYYAHTSASEFLVIYGQAQILYDRAKVEEIWTPLARAWFTEGAEDPEVSLIKISPIEAHYWDTRHNKMVQLMKMMAGAVIGKPLDDSVEGKIVLQ